MSVFRGSGTEADLIGNRLLIISAEDYQVVELDGAQPWPADLHAWLTRRPEFDPEQPNTMTVAGTDATIIDALAEWAPGPGQRDVQLLIVPREIGSGGEEALHEGTFRWRFIEVETRAGAAVVFIQWAPPDGFEAWTHATLDVIGSVELDE